MGKGWRRSLELHVYLLLKQKLLHKPFITLTLTKCLLYYIIWHPTWHKPKKPGLCMFSFMFTQRSRRKKTERRTTREKLEREKSSTFNISRYEPSRAGVSQHGNIFIKHRASITNISYADIRGTTHMLTLTSSMRLVSWPMLSGSALSLLLLALSTRRGRPHTHAGSTDSWFRLQHRNV